MGEREILKMGMSTSGQCSLSGRNVAKNSKEQVVGVENDCVTHRGAVTVPKWGQRATTSLSFGPIRLLF